MALPVTIPNTFANATSSIPLSQLDTNFSTLANAVNGLNSGSETLANLKATTANVGVLTVTGNATIGDASTDTVTLNSTLTANTAVIFAAGTSAAPSITTTGDTNTGIFFPAADTIAFSEGGAEAMRIDSNGVVGIGVVPSGWSSSYKTLQIRNGSLLGDGNDIYFGANLYFDGANNRYIGTGFASQYIQASGEHVWRTAPSGTAGNILTVTEVMRIDSSGNVGIGTTSPTSFLSNWNGLAVGTTSGSNGIAIVSGTTSPGTLAFANGSSGSDQYRGYIQYGHSSDALLFGTAASERMRIDSSGNLGLGVTPSAWSTSNSVRAIQTIGSTVIWNFATNNSYFGNNYYWNGTNRIYLTNSAATEYRSGEGVHTFASASSGTAGNAVTFTNVLSVEKDKSLALQGASTQTGTGITFPATQSASSNANTLDDYEEGTFTPVAEGSTSAGTATYTIQVGNYTKIGNRVLFNLRIDYSSGNGTGNLRVGGLPFTSSSSGNLIAVSNYIESVTFTANNIGVAGVVQNSTYISIDQIPVGGGGANTVPYDGAAVIILAGQYFV